MRNKLLAGGLGLVMVVALIAAAPPTAAPTVALPFGATVITDFGCGIVPADWGGPIFLFSPDRNHSVATPSGNTTLKCHFDIPAGLEPSKAFRARGFGCGTFLGFTTNSMAVASPGGKVTLTCQINGS